MGPWVRREQSKMIDALDSWMAPGTEGILSRIEPNLLFSSAEKLKNDMDMLITTCSDLSPRQPLFEVSIALQELLTSYTEKLTDQLPTADKVTQPLDANSVKEICCVVGTCEFCDEMTTKLEAAILDVIDPAFKDDVSFADEQDIAREVLTRAIKVLVMSVLTCVDDALRKMIRTNWAQFVMDPALRSSPFVEDVEKSLRQQFEPLSKYLSQLHFCYFCDKFVQAFVGNYIEQIFACHKVSQDGAQQLLKDTSYITTTLLEVPVECTGRQMQTMYSKYVINEMGKAETMLRALSMPDVDASEVASMLGDGSSPESAMEIDRLLALRTDQPTSGIDTLKHQMKLAGFKIQDRIQEAHENNLKTGEALQYHVSVFGDTLKQKHAKTSEDLKRMHHNVKKKLIAFDLPGGLAAKWGQLRLGGE